MKKIGIIIVFMLFFSAYSKTITRKPVVRECPVCHFISTYNIDATYKSNIQNWPSEYQFIFWPFIDEMYFYCCTNCHFSCYSSDFNNISKKKASEIRDFLYTFSFDKGTNNYMDISVGSRLEIAGIVYRILGRNKEFWCHYYRVCAYYNDLEGQHETAADYRNKAIRTTQSMMNKAKNSGRNKELLIIMASLYHYTNQTDSALICLEKAKPLKRKNWKEKRKTNSIKNEKLNTLITQFEEFIRTKRKDSIN